MGYVWCDGYVWDMSGVRYANNLLKNPATKRLSGKNKRSCNICLSNKLLVYDVCVVQAVWCYISGFIFLEKSLDSSFRAFIGFVNSFLCQSVPACCEAKQVYQLQSNEICHLQL